jgi:hypothetical protein
VSFLVRKRWPLGFSAFMVVAFMGAALRGFPRLLELFIVFTALAVYAWVDWEDAADPTCPECSRPYPWWSRICPGCGWTQPKRRWFEA